MWQLGHCMAGRLSSSFGIPRPAQQLLIGGEIAQWFCWEATRTSGARQALPGLFWREKIGCGAQVVKMGTSQKVHKSRVFHNFAYKIP